MGLGHTTPVRNLRVAALPVGLRTNHGTGGHYYFVTTTAPNFADLMARADEKSCSTLRHGRHVTPKTLAIALITRRSEVQILPPPRNRGRSEPVYWHRLSSIQERSLTASLISTTSGRSGASVWLDYNNGL